MIFDEKAKIYPSFRNALSKVLYARNLSKVLDALNAIIAFVTDVALFQGLIGLYNYFQRR